MAGQGIHVLQKRKRSNVSEGTHDVLYDHEGTPYVQMTSSLPSKLYTATCGALVQT